MNPALLAIIGALSALMLIIFLATGQPLHLTISAVLLTGGLSTLAAFFFGREQAAEDMFGEEAENDTAEAETNEEAEAIQSDR